MFRSQPSDDGGGPDCLPCEMEKGCRLALTEKKNASPVLPFSCLLDNVGKFFLDKAIKTYILDTYFRNIFREQKGFNLNA